MSWVMVRYQESWLCRDAISHGARVNGLSAAVRRKAEATRARPPPSHQLDRRIVNQAKLDAADQPRTARLGGGDRGLGLPQRTDIRSERHDAAEHQRNRPEGGGQT